MSAASLYFYPLRVALANFTETAHRLNVVNGDTIVVDLPTNFNQLDPSHKSVQKIRAQR